MSRVKFAIPKGSLKSATYDLLSKAMLRLRGYERTYRPVISDPELDVKIPRPQEIPLQLPQSAYDIGITGIDWIKETGADVLKLLDLEYGWIRLVVAAPKNWNYASLDEVIEDYARKRKTLRISTEYLNTTAHYIAGTASYKRLYGGTQPKIVTPWWVRGGNDAVQIYLSFGVTEAKPPEDADIIVDASQTGITLEQKNLKTIEVIAESTAFLIANEESYEDAAKREKILDVITLLKGVVESGKKLHIFANVKAENLNELLLTLPALKSSTVSPLSTQGWYAINIVISKKDFLTILPQLRKLAQGLVVHEPQLILPLEEIAQKGSEGS